MPNLAYKLRFSEWKTNERERRRRISNAGFCWMFKLMFVDRAGEICFDFSLIFIRIKWQKCPKWLELSLYAAKIMCHPRRFKVIGYWETNDRFSWCLLCTVHKSFCAPPIRVESHWLWNASFDTKMPWSNIQCRMCGAWMFAATPGNFSHFAEMFAYLRVIFTKDRWLTSIRWKCLNILNFKRYEIGIFFMNFVYFRGASSFIAF